MYMCYVYGVKSVIPILRSKHADTCQICPALQLVYPREPLYLVMSEGDRSGDRSIELIYKCINVTWPVNIDHLSTKKLPIFNVSVAS